MANTDISAWFLSIAPQIMDMKPEAIAIIAVNDKGETGTSYYGCDAMILGMMDGVLQQDAMFERIKANKEWLKGILESEDEE